MKEVTRIITVRLTFVEKVEDDCEIEMTEKELRRGAEVYKGITGADHAEIVEVQDFIMDDK